MPKLWIELVDKGYIHSPNRGLIIIEPKDVPKEIGKRKTTTCQLTPFQSNVKSNKVQKVKLSAADFAGSKSKAEVRALV